MRPARISRRGQITVPADVRKRWGEAELSIEDLGYAFVLRPIPADPIRAAVGSLAGPGPTSDEMRAMGRHEEELAERRRLRAHRK